MRVLDISMALGHGLHTYPGDTPFTRRESRSIAQGDSLNLSELLMSSHAGTHVDAPSHFLAKGKTLDEMPPDAWSGPAIVVELLQRRIVDRSALRSLDVQRGEILLLKTSNSARLREESFFKDYVYLDESGAQWLVDQKIKAIGIDYLSIEGCDVRGHPVHRLLLGHGVGIIEGLDLSMAAAGRYWLVCYPLKVVGGEGGPARAVLLEKAPSGVTSPP